MAIESNPEPRPANGATTLTVPANWGADPKRNNVTVSVSGRRVAIYQRDKDPRKP